jgi:hypothetical protein
LGHTDSFDGRTFAFIGEPFRGRVDLVELFKDPHFTTMRGTTFSRVPTDEQITAAWEAEPNAPMIGPFDAVANAVIDANVVADQTRSISTHVLMWISPKYLSLVIGKSLTPRQLWMDVASKVIQDNLAEECRPFLDWMALAGIRHEAGAESHVARPPLAPPLSSPRLLTDRADLLLQLLPGLALSAPAPSAAPTTTTEAVIGLPLATALTELASSFRAPVTTVAPKTRLSKWDAIHNATLLMLCGVETEEELPSVWAAFANAGKGDCAVLECALQQIQLHSFCHCAAHKRHR